jgi:aryl-alcohol dehydrogenase-like predicted oxidoreductase
MVEITAPDGTALSALCFGCMQFGGTADEAASQEMYEACRAKGVTFFDTAHLYTDGKSETFLGRFAKDVRDSLIIATKAAYSGGSGRDNILSNFDESRARLGFDMVDILYLHQWDDDTPLEESFETLAELQQAGHIRFIGVSNFAAWQVMKAQAVAAKLGTRIDILQPMYSLVKRQAEVEILPMALSERIAVAPYSPLGGGLLTGKYAQGGAGGDGRLATNDRYAARYGQDWMHRTAADLTRLAGEMGHDPATLAVAWAAHNPGVTAPIISARSAAQLAPSLAAMDLTLSDEDYARIEALSQRPAPATDRLEETAG